MVPLNIEICALFKICLLIRPWDFLVTGVVLTSKAARMEANQFLCMFSLVPQTILPPDSAHRPRLLRISWTNIGMLLNELVLVKELWGTTKVQVRTSPGLVIRIQVSFFQQSFLSHGRLEQKKRTLEVIKWVLILEMEVQVVALPRTSSDCRQVI